MPNVCFESLKLHCVFVHLLLDKVLDLSDLRMRNIRLEGVTKNILFVAKL